MSRSYIAAGSWGLKVAVRAAGVVILATWGATGVAETLVDDGKPMTVTFAGASAQGNFAVIGEALTEMVRREYPGSAASYEPGSNAGAVIRLMQGDAEFSFLSTVMAQRAEAGVDPFQSKLSVYDSIGTIFPPTTMGYYVIARKEFLEKNGVATLRDIREKKLAVRICLNQKGNVEVYHGALALLKAEGISEMDIRSWGGELFYVPSGAYTDMIKDGKLDIVITAGNSPDRRVLEMQQATPVTLLPLSESSLDTVSKELGLERVAIPKSTYDFLAQDYPTLALTLWVVAGPAATDREAFKFAKAVYNQLEFFRNIHPMFKNFSADSMPVHGPFRLHPGAAAFYREVGLAIPGS